MNEIFLSSEEILSIRRPYEKPRITILGDLHTITLAGSPGVGDSGNPLNQNPLPGPGGYIPGQQDVI